MKLKNDMFSILECTDTCSLNVFNTDDGKQCIFWGKTFVMPWLQIVKEKYNIYNQKLFYPNKQRTACICMIIIKIVKEIFKSVFNT